MKSRKKKILAITLTLLGIIGIAAALLGIVIYTQRDENITSYEECIVANNTIIRSSPDRCSLASGKTFTKMATKNAEITIEGSTVCLPHKNEDQPHTMECAMGIKADDGTYYGLSTDTYNTELSVTNRRVLLSGTLTHIANSKYQNTETITVTSYEFLN